MYENLPPRGSIAPNLFPAEEGRGKEVVRGVESSKVTSVSQCESDRGTHGRGTPPIREEGQPRLDELFRQLQLKQVCLHVHVLWLHTTGAFKVHLRIPPQVC